MFGPCSGGQDREGEEATTGAQREAFEAWIRKVGCLTLEGLLI